MFVQRMRSTITRGVLAALVCLLCIFSPSWVPKVAAHNLGQSYLYLQVGEDTIGARVELPLTELNRVLELELPTDKKIRREDIEPHIDTIRTYVDEHTALDCNPQTCRLAFQNFRFLNTTFAQFLLLEYDLAGFDTLPSAIDVSFDVILEQLPQHTTMLLIEENWMTGTFQNESEPLMVFQQPDQTRTLDLSSGSIWQGFFSIVSLGIIHILKGIDHVLFLVALLLPSVLRRQQPTGWQSVGKFSTVLVYIIKIATAFTVAHSITLGLATLNIIQVPPRLVESAMAASIGLAAMEIFYPIFRGRAWLIVFLFGLFHGFGFANVLSGLGITNRYTFLSLFGFNLGLVVGQLLIIAVVVPIIYWLSSWQIYPRVVLKASALLLGAISIYWFIERAFAINIRFLPLVQGLF